MRPSTNAVENRESGAPLVSSSADRQHLLIGSGVEVLDLGLELASGPGVAVSTL